MSIFLRSLRVANAVLRPFSIRRLDGRYLFGTDKPHGISLKELKDLEEIKDADDLVEDSPIGKTPMAEVPEGFVDVEDLQRLSRRIQKDFETVYVREKTRVPEVPDNVADIKDIKEDIHKHFTDNIDYDLLSNEIQKKSYFAPESFSNVTVPQPLSPFVTSNSPIQLQNYYASTFMANENLKEEFDKLSPEEKESIQQMVLAVERAVAPPGTTRGEMPLHELANRSVKIQELVKLGVDLSVIIKRECQMEKLLHLNLEHDIKPRIRFLVDLGVEPDNLGWLITKNPSVLWEDKDDLQVRVNYLESKLFKDEDIKRILNKAPFWLSFRTKDIDYRLGYFQKGFKLSGQEVRNLATMSPSFVTTSNWSVVQGMVKLLDRKFGFSKDERKELLLKKPRVFLNPHTVNATFDYFHHTVGFSHSVLTQHPNLLTTRLLVTKTRHLFSKFLGKDEFNPTKPGYISPDSLWEGSNEKFCEKVDACIDDYYNFFRTI